MTTDEENNLSQCIKSLVEKTIKELSDICQVKFPKRMLSNPLINKTRNTFQLEEVIEFISDELTIVFDLQYDMTSKRFNYLKFYFPELESLVYEGTNRQEILLQIENYGKQMQRALGCADIFKERLEKHLKNLSLEITNS